MVEQACSGRGGWVCGEQLGEGCKRRNGRCVKSLCTIAFEKHRGGKWGSARHSPDRAQRRAEGKRIAYDIVNHLAHCQ